MLTATRREWNELYVFFNLLAQGGIVLGNEEGLPSGRVLPIFQVTRQEHDRHPCRRGTDGRTFSA